MGKPDWPEIRRLANEISTATVGLRKSLIKDDFEAGPLIPVKAQCEDLGLLLDEALDSLAKDIGGDMVTTARQALETVLDLKGQVTILINIAISLQNDPGVKDRVELEKNWNKYSKKTISESRDSADLLRSFVEIIDLQGLTQKAAPRQERRADLPRNYPVERSR